MVLRFERPDIIARFLGMNENDVRWNKTLDTLLMRRLFDTMLDMVSYHDINL